MKSGEQQALSRDNDGKNALMHAAERGHAEIVEMLLTMDSAQEQAAARNNNDRSALECALIDGQIEVFMMLTEFLRGE
jgi:ankyrin repeat protein